MRGLCCFLLAFSLTCFAGMAFAAGVGPRAVRIENVVTKSGSVYARTVYSYRQPSTAMVVYQAREVVTSAATSAKLLRFAASPAGLLTASAVTSFFEWWQANKGPISPDAEFSLPGSTGECANGSVLFSNCGLYGGGGTASSLAQCKAQTLAAYAGWTITSVYSNATFTQLTVIARHSSWPAGQTTEFTRWGRSASGCPNPTTQLEPWDVENDEQPPSSWLPYLPEADSGSSNPATDGELWDEFINSPFANDESILRDILTDQNGVPWDTPENQAMRRQIWDELAQEDGASLPSGTIDSGPSADPSNPDAPLSQPAPYESVPPTTGGGSASQIEVPEFCGWASVVCDWLGWTQEPLETLTDAPDLPVVEGSVGTWDSGLGDGACPAPTIISALGASIPISWQPACDFVSMLRPILIAFAGIAAALILLGQRAGGAG